MGFLFDVGVDSHFGDISSLNSNGSNFLFESLFGHSLFFLNDHFINLFELLNYYFETKESTDSNLIDLCSTQDYLC